MGIISPVYSPRRARDSAPVLPRLQLVATRGQGLGQNPNKSLDGGAPDNYTRHQSRFRFRLGPRACTDFRLLYGNYFLTAGLGDTAGPDDITLMSALEVVGDAEGAGPIAYPMTLAGRKSFVVESGAAHVLTDPLGLTMQANGDLWVRTDLTVPAGKLWPFGLVPSATGEGAYNSTDAASQVYNTGGYVNSTGVSANGYCALALLGRPERPMPAYLISGDSIADGSGDANIGDGNGNRGFVTRGLWDVDGVAYPWIRMTKPSDNPIAQRSRQSWRRQAPWQYCTHMILEHGGNQLANVGSAAEMLDWLRVSWAMGRRRGMKVIQCTLGPRTNSTDAWATAAGQTPLTGFEPGGKREQLNTLIRQAYAAGEFDDLVDVAAVWEDPANPGKWITNGTANYPTADGTHPSAAFHTLGAAPVRAMARRQAY